MPQIPDHSSRILVISGSGSVKTSLLFNIISHLPDIDKIYLYAEDPKYQLLIGKREDPGLKCFSVSKAFIEYSNGMFDIYKNIDEYISDNERKVLIVTESNSN